MYLQNTGVLRQCLLPTTSKVFPRLQAEKVKTKMQKTIILNAVLYRHKTLSPTPKERHWLRIFENTAMKRVFGFKGE
jgi:hypothetical protein